MPAGRPNQGKTETIKERRIDIYAPGLRVKARWDEEAERRKQSRSVMVFELVELALAAERDPEARAPNGALSGRVEELQAQLGILRRRNQDLEALKERLERELEEYRALVATGETPLPNIGKRLVSLFAEAFGGDGRARPVDAAELRQGLGIEPADTVRMRELQQAIAMLEVQGLLRKHAKGGSGLASRTLIEHPPVIASFQEDLEAQGLTAASRASYAQQASRFVRWLDRHPREVSRDDLKRYLLKLQREKKNAQTIHHNFVGIGSLMQYLEEEGLIEINPVPSFRRRYLRNVMREVDKYRKEMRQLISIQDMARFVASILDARDQALAMLLAKTGIRREECRSIDVDDIQWEEQSILLKNHSKRTQLTVYFDDETARLLRRWLIVREARGTNPTEGPLFTGTRGGRLPKDALRDPFTAYAQAVGLHKPGGALKERFTPHCCRHWFTTWLRRRKMNPAHVAWLRGDKESSTQSIYNHIDREEVRQEYLACVPQLGVA